MGEEQRQLVLAEAVLVAVAESGLEQYVPELETAGLEQLECSEHASGGCRRIAMLPSLEKHHPALVDQQDWRWMEKRLHGWSAIAAVLEMSSLAGGCCSGSQSRGLGRNWNELDHSFVRWCEFVVAQTLLDLVVLGDEIGRTKLVAVRAGNHRVRQIVVLEGLRHRVVVASYLAVVVPVERRRRLLGHRSSE